MRRSHPATPPCRASTWWFLHRLMFSKTLGISPNDAVFADLWVVWLLFLARGGECDPVIYSYIAFHDCCFPNDAACGMNELLPHNLGVGSDLDGDHAARPYSNIHQMGQDSAPALVTRYS